MSVDYQNACLLLKYWTQIRDLCSDYTSNAWAAELYKLMADGNENLFKSELGVLVLYFDRIIAPYFEQSSKLLDPKKIRELIKETKAKFQKIIHARYDQHFEVLIATPGKNSKRVAQISDLLLASKKNYHSTMTKEQKKNWHETCRLDTITRLSAESMLSKFVKDTNCYYSIDYDSIDKIPLSNQRIERSGSQN